jgi:hypothetical protein
MSISITRTTFLQTSRVWPTWLPEALVEMQRQALIAQLPQTVPRVSRQPPSFQFSACLQSLFLLQDSILGVANPLHFQHARNFSQQSVARRRALSLQQTSTLAPGTGSLNNRLEHTASRPRRALSAPQPLDNAKTQRYTAMKSRILSVL